MRLRLVLKKTEHAFLPFNYGQFVHAMILDKLDLADPEYAQEMHDSRGFKFFTFSDIDIPEKRMDKAKTGFEVLSDSISLLVSSPRERFLKAFLSGLLIKPEARIGASEYVLESATTEEPPDFSPGRAVLRTLSPIVASTIREIQGKRRSWDLMPEEAGFYENVKKNLLRKYAEFHGEAPADPSFAITVKKPLRTRRIMIKRGEEETFHVGSRMVFEACGSPELLEFAYECGLGEKNSMGFGMVEVVG